MKAKQEIKEALNRQLESIPAEMKLEYQMNLKITALTIAVNALLDLKETAPTPRPKSKLKTKK